MKEQINNIMISDLRLAALIKTEIKTTQGETKLSQCVSASFIGC